MSCRYPLLLLVTLIPFLWGSAAFAEQALAPKPSPATPVYKPPLRGAPATRVGGGTRNPAATDLVLYVLAPEHTGLTTQEQPILYWYISKPARARIEITLIDESSVQPLLETAVAEVAKPGIQALNLAEHGIRLEPGVEYQWSVAVVRNPDQRSSDVVSSGGIRRIEPTATLAEELREASEEAQVAIYAGAGIWYDALMSLEKRMGGSPENASLRAMRAALLKQVGLPETLE